MNDHTADHSHLTPETRKHLVGLAMAHAEACAASERALWAPGRSAEQKAEARRIEMATFHAFLGAMLDITWPAPYHQTALTPDDAS